MLSDVPAVVGELRAALDRLTALDPTDLADPSLLVGLSELFDVETVLRAVQTRWLAIADARETHRYDRDSTVSWGKVGVRIAGTTRYGATARVRRQAPSCSHRR